MKPAAYQTLNAWRGFASLWVVLFHAAAVIVTAHPALRSHPLFVFSALGFLGVPLFFVVSGYCIAGSALSAARHTDARSFLQARLRRIYPTCWASLAFYAAFSLLASALAAHGYLRDSNLARHDLLHREPLYYLANLALLQIPLGQPFLSIVCWTLCYEMAFYLCVGLLLWATRRREQGEILLLNALHVVTVCALLLLTLAPHRRFYPLDLWPQFGIGVLVYDLVAHPGQARPRAWTLVIGLQAIAFMLLRDIGLGYLGQPSRLSFGLSLGFALVLARLYRWDRPLSRLRPVIWLSRVGEYSYSLYLTHFLCIGVVSQIVRRIPAMQQQPYAVFGVSILAALGFAALFYRWFERPFLQPGRTPAPEREPARRVLSLWPARTGQR